MSNLNFSLLFILQIKKPYRIVIAYMANQYTNRLISLRYNFGISRPIFLTDTLMCLLKMYLLYGFYYFYAVARIFFFGEGVNLVLLF